MMKGEKGENVMSRTQKIHTAEVALGGVVVCVSCIAMIFFSRTEVREAIGDPLLLVWAAITVCFSVGVVPIWKAIAL
jgi:hypothetical protein